jgi:hypothetical protein
MPTHEGLPVSGYRPQTTTAVDLVNENKRLEELSLRALDRLKDSGMCDPRWLATGRTDLEKAWMAINRSVFQPSRVTLPEDTP